MANPDRNIRLSGILKELIATFIRHEANSNPMITLTNIDLSPDGKRALLFVTTIPDGREQDALIFLKRNATNLRNYLKKNARIKNIPHLEFMVDAGERHRQHMDELVREIEDKKK
ncbi:ribosome-binding factor A [Candidatus Kaiserbacteria bacterium]|nr:ribosome-binding factor A [Candidatus Kaiserbacteria bacterium]MCA9360858.1 ribosome-binding factor A [Candidatus Kaiserbacteria bacterium]MCB9815289.1 ribosome-binding factor A [Candidatus Nomurabacteria bacterium]